MASSTSMLKKQRDELLKSMLEEGLVDDNFNEVEALGGDTNREFLVDLISLFIEDAERILSELTKTLSETDVDFNVADALVHQVKGTSSSVGGQKIVVACLECRQFCEKKDLDGCIKGFEVVKTEFNNLKSRLESFIEIERKILASY